MGWVSWSGSRKISVTSDRGYLYVRSQIFLLFVLVGGGGRGSVQQASASFPSMFSDKEDVLKSIQRGKMRRGEYRPLTFRLPMHMPEVLLKIGLESGQGCICLYVSNCSERPRPRMCQWALL
eukprot:2776481-Prymnesium_polylepis.1